MTLVDLTFLILNLNHLVDYSYHEGVSLDEVKVHIRKGDLLTWLGQRFEGHIDVSLFTHHPDVSSEIIKGLQDLLGAFDGRERRKWGVEHNGICLLIAWVNELIQQRASTR